MSSSPFLSGKFSEITTPNKLKYTCKIPQNFFGSQVYNLSLCFIKNLFDVENQFVGRVIKSEDFNKKTNTEVVMFLENIITFKPIFNNNNNFNIDLSNIDLHGSLLPSFEWNSKII